MLVGLATLYVENVSDGTVGIVGVGEGEGKATCDGVITGVGDTVGTTISFAGFWAELAVKVASTVLATMAVIPSLGPERTRLCGTDIGLTVQVFRLHSVHAPAPGLRKTLYLLSFLEPVCGF